jgi:tetratricopeptide (TPR) repeat protein
MGFCYIELKKPGLGAYFLEKAFRLNKEDIYIAKNLGYLFDRMGILSESARYWQIYLDNESDDEIFLALAFVYYKLKEYDKAQKELDKIQKRDFGYYNLAAKIAIKKDLYEKAKEFFIKANRIEKDEYLMYEYAIFLKTHKKYDESIKVMRMLNETFSKDIYKKELAYLLLKVGKTKESKKLFESLHSKYPNEIEYLMQLAYINKKLEKNKEAKRLFMKIIDENLTDDIETNYQVKSEIKNIDKRFDFYFAQTIRLDSGNSKTKGGYPTPIQQSTYDGNGGLMIAYKPEIFKRYIAVFGEANHGHSYSIDETLQSSLGIRYMPFQDYRVVFSLSQMFKTGKYTRDETFIRVSSSLFDGYDYRPTKKKYSFHNLYIDGGYFTKKKSTILSANYDFGKIYKIKNRFSFLPYASLGGNYSNDNKNNESVTKVDVGFGLSILNWFWETKYKSNQLTSRIKLEYRGKIAGNNNDNETFRLRVVFMY